MPLYTPQPFTISSTASGESTSPAYSVGDMVGTELSPALTVASGLTVPNGAEFVIDSIELEDDGATTEQVRLMWFNAASSPAADNAANSWSDANMQKLIGQYDMPALIASALNSYVKASGLWIRGKLASGDNKLYLNMIALTSFTSSATTALNVILSGQVWL